MGTYIQAEDIKDIAQKLKSKYIHTFSDVNLERILFIKELDKEAKVIGTVKKVPEALNAFYSHNYYMTISSKKFDTLALCQKHLAVMELLLHCDSSDDKIRQPEIKTFPEMLAFPTNWKERDNDNVDDIRDPLEETIELGQRPSQGEDQYTQIMREDHNIQ